jgi:undecaprenyl-diphosphatase
MELGARLSRLATRRAAVRLAIVGAIVSGALFVALGLEVAEGEHQRLDEQLLQQLRRSSRDRAGSSAGVLYEASRDVTALGSPAVLTLVVIGVAGYFAFARELEKSLLVLFATLGGVAFSQLAKSLMMRPRPQVVPHLTDVSSPSFPSGHALLSTVVYLTLGAILAELAPRLRLRVYLLASGIVLALLVGVSRAHLGVHYPSDILAGWAGGVCWALSCWLVVQSLSRGRRRDERPEKPRPR